MKTKLIISLSCMFATGACFAQAPVVDLQDAVNNANAGSPTAGSSIQLTDDEIRSFDLQSRLEALEQIVDSRTESTQRMQTRIDDLQNDIDEMRGSIELHNHQLEKLLERQRELFLELDRRFEGMQQSTANLSNDIANTGVSGGSAPAAPAGDQQSAYQAAVNLILQDKDYDSAIPAFQSFLASYPVSDLTPNAHYWLGQLLYNKQDYTLAKEQFAQVANNFTSSPKRADSLLKLGLIEKSNGNLSAANQFFQQVLSEYPDSTFARLASQQLGN